MVSNISPYRPNPKEDAAGGQSDRVKPRGAPRDDSFRKSMKDRPPLQDQEDYAVEDQEKPPSLFDLPKSKTNIKSSLSGKSTLKDPATSELTQRFGPVKQDPEDHGQEPDQDFAKSTTSSESETASSDMPEQLPTENETEDFYATVEKFPPAFEKPPVAFKESPAEEPPAAEELSVAEELSATFEKPNTAVEKSPAASKKPAAFEDFGTFEKPPIAEGKVKVLQSEKPPEQPQAPGQFKKPTDQQLQSPMDVLKQAPAAATPIRHPKTKETDEASSFGTSKVGEGSKKQKTGKSDESKSKSEEGAEVRGDAAAGAVNLSIQSTDFQTEKAPESQETIHSANIRELAAQIIDSIQIMRKGNETQTIIRLHHPEVLKNATITLTTSDHAKREFNIAFGNLSPDAKLLLDRRLKEDSLTETLERKGIVVHVLTTSTQETALNVNAGEGFRDRQEQQQQQQQQQQRQKRENFQRPEDEESA